MATWGASDEKMGFNADSNIAIKNRTSKWSCMPKGEQWVAKKVVEERAEGLWGFSKGDEGFRDGRTVSLTRSWLCTRRGKCLGVGEKD